MLKPQDVLITLKLTTLENATWTFDELAASVTITLSAVHRAFKRAQAAGLVKHDRTVNRQALYEFVVHGVRYVYYAERGALTRGMPTAHAAPPLDKLILTEDLVPVWPDPQGTVRGYSLMPLHEAAPAASRNDPCLYERLALIDAIRSGGARERKLAIDELKKRLLA